MVEQVLELLAAGLLPREITTKWFPTLTLQDVYACVAFANQFVRREELTVSHR